MSLIDAFFDQANDLELATLGEEARRRLEPWLDRWETGRGPAFLPRQHAGTLSWYGLMDDGPQRRELEQLLQHWVGPSCSDVQVRRGALDPNDPFDTWLSRELPGRVVRLDVRPKADDDEAAFRHARDLVRSRLERLAAMLDKRPEPSRAVNSGLGGALDDVYLRAASGDQAGAEELLRALERRRMLDAPNTAFIRLRILSLSGDVEGVLGSPDLADLDGQHLPRGIANLVARALATAVFSDDTRPVSVSDMPRHVVRAVLQADSSDREIARVLDLLGPVTSSGVPKAPRDDEEPLDAELDDEGGPEGADVDPMRGSSESAPVVEESPPTLDGARAYSLWMGDDHDTLLTEFTSHPPHPDDVVQWAVLAADKRGDYEAAASVLTVLEEGSRTPDGGEWRIPGAAEAYYRLRLRRDGSISSWADWFESASSGGGASEEVLDGAIDWQPLPAQDARVWIDRMGAEILVPVLGRFLATHRDEWTIEQWATLTPSLLEALALSERAGHDVRNWSATLVSDALDGSLDPEARREVLGALRVILSQQLNKGTIAWALDLVGEVVDAWHGVAEGECRLLLTEMLDLLRDCKAAITRTDVGALTPILEPFSMRVPGDLVAHLDTSEEADPLACHAGRSILIYSLRERSARQAAARLAHLPGTTVTLSHEKAGSQQLAGQVAGADLVVIVTAAAKHAATEFIEERATGTTLQVNTAGASGLVSALEAQCQ